VLIENTGWVKVPVQFLALAAVARSGPRRSASQVFRQALGLGLFGENDLQTGVTWRAHLADRPGAPAGNPNNLLGLEIPLEHALR
jgi:hypothetical protein